jgi:hypothetical protein
MKSRLRGRLLPFYTTTAPLALALALILERLDISGLDFWIGFLVGYSIAGNLVAVCGFVHARNDQTSVFGG